MCSFLKVTADRFKPSALWGYRWCGCTLDCLVKSHMQGSAWAEAFQRLHYNLSDSEAEATLFQSVMELTLCAGKTDMEAATKIGHCKL